MDALAPYFERLVFVLSTAVDADRDGAVVAREMAAADRFVFHSVDDSFASAGHRRILRRFAEASR